MQTWLTGVVNGILFFSARGKNPDILQRRRPGKWLLIRHQEIPDALSLTRVKVI